MIRALLHPAPTPDRFLSVEQCEALTDRLATLIAGGGTVALNVDSQWTSNLRWARNQITTGGDTQNTTLIITRDQAGAVGHAETNALDTASLQAAVRGAEAQALRVDEDPTLYPTAFSPRPVPVVHPIAKPVLWFDRTYAFDAMARTQAVAPLMEATQSQGLVSAGYVQIGAHASAVIAHHLDIRRYYPATQAQFSVTVRDLRHNSAGWAGVDFNDWGRIDPVKLHQIAIDKCIRSRDPVAVEPGRFTTMLEPQAVCDLWSPLFDRQFLDRTLAENFGVGPFARPGNKSAIGEKILDERLSLMADPMDPDGGFIPFDSQGEPYLPVKWIDHGVLRELSYYRDYGRNRLHKDWALPDSKAFRLQNEGTSVTLEQMIADTERGLLVTRFYGVTLVDGRSLMSRGTTRSGFWLVERGKITKAAKNMWFTESPLFVFNSVEQIGTPQRVFRPAAPAVCPPVKVRDFNFTGLSDAV